MTARELLAAHGVEMVERETNAHVLTGRKAGPVPHRSFNSHVADDAGLSYQVGRTRSAGIWLVGVVLALLARVRRSRPAAGPVWPAVDEDVDTMPMPLLCGPMRAQGAQPSVRPVRRLDDVEARKRLARQIGDTVDELTPWLVVTGGCAVAGAVIVAAVLAVGPAPVAAVLIVLIVGAVRLLRARDRVDAVVVRPERPDGAR